MHIEFFHDVLCAWCYALSPRMHRLVDTYPDIVFVHRSFALASHQKRLDEMFGSKEEAKEEILKHWEAANRNDDEHRINYRLMAQRNFDYPYSMPPLMACKAAEFQGGQSAHWEYFDRVQKAHLTDCYNVADDEVLLHIALDMGLDKDRYIEDFTSGRARLAVEADNERARRFGIRAVPSLLVDENTVISGALPYEAIVSRIEQL